MGTAISGEEPTSDLIQKVKKLDAEQLEYNESDYGQYATGYQANVQWDNMIGNKSPNDLLNESIDPNNNQLNNDPCLQRLVFIVNQYNNIQKNKSSAYAFIDGLKSFSLIQLLNDWIHIKSVYVDNKYENMNFNRLAIWNYLNLSLIETEESEDIYTRNKRERSVLGEESVRKDVYNGYSDTRNVVAIQLLDSLHCFLYHGESVNDKKLIQQKREWETKCGVSAQLKNVSTMLQNAQDQDDQKGKDLTKRKRDYLHFGQPFFYWDFFEGDEFHCIARYKSLKSEILNNEIFNLTLVQFNDLVFLSELWQKSIIGQFCTAFNRGGDMNEMYEIEPGLPLSLSHICAILLFTNYDLLSFKYTVNGCNALRQNEPYNDIKQRNAQIGIWYKLMREVTLFYGESTQIGQTFYFCMDEHLLFDSFAPQIYSAFVASTSLSSAQIFSADKGAMIEFTQHSSVKNFFIDVSYCCPFPHRDLKLFGFASTFEVNDVILMQDKFGNVISNKLYARAMLIWQRIINGQFYHNLLDFVSNQYQKCIMLMMDNELNHEKYKKYDQSMQNGVNLYHGFEENGVPKYVQMLFRNVLKQSKAMWIIQSEYAKLSVNLQNYVLTLHNNQFKSFAVLWNKRLRKAHGMDLSFKFANEYVWSLDEEDIAQYKELKHGQLMEGPELSLQLTQNDYDAFIFKPMLAKTYDDNSGLSGFALTLTKLPQKFKRVLVEWDLHCQEANDFVLSSPLRVMYNRDIEGYSTWNPQLLEGKKSITFRVCVKIKQST